MDELFFIYNDQFFLQGQPVISAGNRSLRYGDGLFETMRISNGKVSNVDFHFDRLFSGLALLQFHTPEQYNRYFFEEKINELLHKNHHQENARVRLMVFRGKGNILGDEALALNYIIESWPLINSIELNDVGLAIDIFPDARKSCDRFSNIKSNNYLPSVMAGLFARKNKLHDAVLLNAFERVCESAIANIFIVKNRDIFTPPLSEGCVAGVIRRCMLQKFSIKNYTVAEKNLSVEELVGADEIFLTNSIQPVKWVQYFRGKKYGNEKISEIYKMIYESF